MKEIIFSIMLWINNSTGYSIPDTPNIKFLETMDLRSYAYGCELTPIPNQNKEICAAKENWENRRNDADTGEHSPPGETTYPSDSTWVESKVDVDPQQMDNAKLVPILTAALQESITKIETLETKVAALEAG